MKLVNAVGVFASRVITQFQIECNNCRCGLTTDGGSLVKAAQGFADKGYCVGLEDGIYYILCGGCAEKVKRKGDPK